MPDMAEKLLLTSNLVLFHLLMVGLMLIETLIVTV